MLHAMVFDYEGHTLHERKFRSNAKLQDWAADLIANDADAKWMDVFNPAGAIVGQVKFDELRDKAALDGYILHVHKKRLAEGDELAREFLAEIEAGRRHF